MNFLRYCYTRRSAVIFIVIAAALCLTLQAQDSRPSRQQKLPGSPEELITETMPSLTPAPAAPLTGPDIEAFLDGMMPLQMDQADIAGGVIVVVKDGKVLFAKGYGYADREKKKPVSVENTLFRPASISKLFTWTSVMQLVEQGKLDLDRDVNEYLDFKIPPKFGQPITLRNIMTHTSGFEDVFKDLFVSKPADMMPLERYLVTHMPARIFPPGTKPAYSNYASALAGYIVQRVSGEKFNDYAAAHIFRPLGMAHATFDQPLPENLKPLMSAGYRLGSGEPEEFEYVPAYPAGGLSVTGADMARFMIAHLQDGEFDGRRILKPETARRMHSRQFGIAPGMNSMCLGFYEESRNGLRIIGHGGDTLWFHSALHLVPAENLGFFISLNSAGRSGVQVRDPLWYSFLDRYHPYRLSPPNPPAAKMADAKDASGVYLTSRRIETKFARLGFYFVGEVAFSASSDGTIQSSSFRGLNGQPMQFEEIGPLMYRELDGQERIAFVRKPGGAMTLATDFPAIEYDSVPWYQKRNFMLLWILGPLAVALLTLVFWPVAALVRRHYRRRLDLSGVDRFLRIGTRIVCAFMLATCAIWTALFAILIDDLTRSSGLVSWFYLAQALTMISVVLMLIPVANMIGVWFGARWWWSRIWETLIGLACVAFVWVAIFGRLLGWTSTY
jgi:CubicO group peptidase (beta-lactamase class C family)